MEEVRREFLFGEGRVDFGFFFVFNNVVVRFVGWMLGRETN